MAEVSSAPGVPSPSGLYPQPPSQQQGALSDPTRLIDLMGSITRNKMLQSELAGRQAIGKAYQGALNPDGTVDVNKFTAGVRSDPAASYMLQDSLEHVNNIARSQFEARFAPDQAVRSVMSSLPRYSTDEQLRQYSTALVRAGVPPAIAEGHRDALMKLHGEQRARAIDVMQSTALPPGQGAGIVEAPPGEGNVPQKQILKERLLGGASGGGGAGRAGYGGTGGTPQAVGPAPGVSEAQTAESVEGQRAAIALQNAANDVPIQRTQLTLMRQDLEAAKTKFGPTAPYEKMANQIASRIVGFGPTMDPKEIAALESFDKVGRQMALSQAASGHATDLTTSTALGANPNTNLSALGNEGIINMLLGNTDWTAVKASEWNDARRGMGPDHKIWGPDQHYQWSQKFNKDSDPRVFQFMRMNDEQRSTLLKAIPDKAAFEKHLFDADRRGWITLPPDLIKPGKPKTQNRAPKSDGKATPSFNDRFNGSQSRAEPPIAGARLAADGHWYVKQPHENGDYQRVVMNA